MEGELTLASQRGRTYLLKLLMLIIELTLASTSSGWYVCTSVDQPVAIPLAPAYVRRDLITYSIYRIIMYKYNYSLSPLMSSIGSSGTKWYYYLFI